MRYKFKKLNDKPITIDFKKYEPRQEPLELEPCFEWKGQTYYLIEFMRAHNNPWTGDLGYPQFIYGYHAYDIDPIYIEIVDGYAVNIYENLSTL